MKKTFLFSACALLLVSCGGRNSNKAKNTDAAGTRSESSAPAKPEYTVLDNPQVDLASFPKDKDGYYTIFDGKTFNGWARLRQERCALTLDNRQRSHQVQRFGYRRGPDR